MYKDKGNRFKRFSKLAFLTSDTTHTPVNNHDNFNEIDIKRDEDTSDIYTTTMSMSREAEEELYLEPSSNVESSEYFVKTVKHKQSLSLDQSITRTQSNLIIRENGWAEKSGVRNQNVRLEVNRPRSDFFPAGLTTQDYQQLVQQSTSPNAQQTEFSSVGLAVPSRTKADDLANVKHRGYISIQPQDELGSESYLATDKLITEADRLLLQHLIESSLHTTQSFQVLQLEVKDRLYKQHLNNQTSIQNLTTRLALETKMQQSAQALITLHTKTNNRKLVQQANLQLQQANKKVEMVGQELWHAYHKSWNTHQTLLEHTAATLALAYRNEESECDRLKFQLGNLREGRMAEIDDSFIDNGVQTTKLRKDQIEVMANRFNNSVFSTNDSFGSNNEGRDEGKEVYGTQLVEALAKVEVQQKHIEELNHENQQQQQAIINKFEQELNLANQRVEELQIQLNQHISNKAKSKSNLEVDKAQKFEELANANAETSESKKKLEQVLDTLQLLFNEIPDDGSEGNEEEEGFDGDAAEKTDDFSVGKLVRRVENLVEENHDLIDKVISLQHMVEEQNQQKNSAKDEVGSEEIDGKISLEKEFAYNELQLALRDLEKYIGKAKLHK